MFFRGHRSWDRMSDLQFSTAESMRTIHSLALVMNILRYGL